MAEPPSPRERFAQTWRARVLSALPLIVPARHFVYPRPVPGEEDALARGALLFEVQPASGGTFLATCALGFRDPGLPSEIFPCPRADDLLAVAGGYAYLIDTLAPHRSLHLPLRPVTALQSSPEDGVLLLAGFHQVCAVDAQGLRWTSKRVSWEGVTLDRVESGHLHGMGWDMRSDQELPFRIDLRTGEHEGGGHVVTD